MTIDQLERAPTSAISERALEYAYRHGVGVAPAVAPCACGVAVVASSRSERDIRRAVEAHNESTAHQQWRAAFDAAQEGG